MSFTGIFINAFLIAIIICVVIWIKQSIEISNQEKAKVAKKNNSAKTTSRKIHNYDNKYENIDEYHWRNVPIKDRPPESFEHWKREKQAKYLNVNVINVFLEKKDKLWIYNGRPYKTPEEPVKNYFINEHKYTELPIMFFEYIKHAVVRKLPKEYKWIKIGDHKFVEHRYQTYREQAMNEVNKLSIDGIVNDSLKTDDYFSSKPVDNPVLYWGLITNKKTLSKWYNALGIEYIKRHANNIIKGGSPGGWPDLSFIDVNRKKIILYEVKTENDRMKRNQYSCYKEISRENCYEYAIVFLNRKSDME